MTPPGRRNPADPTEEFVTDGTDHAEASVMREREYAGWCRRCGEAIPDPDCPTCHGTGVERPAH